MTKFTDVLIERGVRELTHGQTTEEIEHGICLFRFNFLPALKKNPNLLVFLNDWRDALFEALNLPVASTFQKRLIVCLLLTEFEPDTVVEPVSQFVSHCSTIDRLEIKRMLGEHSILEHPDVLGMFDPIKT